MGVLITGVLLCVQFLDEPFEILSVKTYHEILEYLEAARGMDHSNGIANHHIGGI